MIINYFILNLNGSIVKNGNIGQNYTEINISDLSNGVYFLKIENENYDKKLNVIINDYINRNNKEQYAMDMTMELIDAGFEDVV